MPGMPLIDHQKAITQGWIKKSDDWTMLTENFASDLSNKNLVHSYYMCSMKNLVVVNSRVSSIFQKCNLSKSFFDTCVFEKDSMFIECNLDSSYFKNCIFYSEEQLIFLKMLGARLIKCKVEGKDELYDWGTFYSQGYR
jgi:uncharacterized protein YjbI with pentapeptide repeats